MTQPNKTIAVLVDEYADYYRLLVSGIQSELAERGYGVLCVIGGMLSQHSGVQSTASNALFSMLADAQVKGVFSMSGSLVNDTRSNEFAEFLRQYNVPVVSVGRVVQGVESVVFNDAPAMHSLMQHLINDTPARRFAFVRGFPTDEASMVRERIFKEELRKHNYDVDSALIVNGNYEVYESYNAVHKLLTRYDDIDAIVAASDIMALSAARAAQTLNISVPNDMVITGFTDSPHSTQHSPALTTVRQPIDALAHQAVETLLELVAHDAKPRLAVVNSGGAPAAASSVVSIAAESPSVCTIDCELVVRGSSAISAIEVDIKNVIEVDQCHGYLQQAVVGLKQPDNVDLHSLAEAINETMMSGTHAFRDCLEIQLQESLNVDSKHWWGNLFHQMESMCNSMCFSDELAKSKELIFAAISKAHERIWSLRMNKEFEKNRLYEVRNSVQLDMSTSIELHDILNVLNYCLFEHSIKRCFLARYDTPSQTPDSNAHLIYEFKNGVSVENTNIKSVDTCFKTNNVLPDRLLCELEHGTLLQYAISAGDDLYGHLLIDPEGIDKIDAAALVQSIGNAMRNQHFLNTLESQTNDLQNANAQLRNTLNTDSLTGLNSRISLQEHIKAIGEKAQQTHGQVTVFHIDMDGFKAINDDLGQSAGDRVLRHVATQLSNMVDQKLGTSGFVSRLASDEFMIVTDSPLNQHCVSEFAEETLNVLSAPFSIKNHDLSMTASIGCVSYPDQIDQVGSLLKCSDAAVSEAKKLGKNRFVVYDPKLTAALEYRARLENEMRQSIEIGEMRLHFQPRIDLRTGNICAAEALMRWLREGPDGLYPHAYPEVFIALAEQSGFITQLDTFGLNEACRQAREWELAGTPLPVSVNVSVVQLQQERFIETVAAALETHQLSPELLELEITESAAMTDVENNITKLNCIKEMGVQISIDDFGTGYSSLNYLKRLPVNNLKIDRSFIIGIEERGDTPTVDETIVKSVIALGKSMDFGLVAEGIETEEQHQFLKSLDCDQAQGYLFSRPVEPAAITQMLNEAYKHKAA